MLEALYVKISESYFQSFNNKTRALEIALRGTKKFPENDRILYQYGLLNYNAKDYQKAIIAFDQLYKRTPDYKGLLQTMSVIFQELENWERVIEINEKRLQLEPNNYYVLRNLAFTNFNIGEYATAIEYFIKFPQLGGGKAEAFTNTGISYYSLNQYSKAIDYLEKAFEVIESYEPEGALGTSKDQIEKRLLPFIFDYLALSYERIGGYNKAIEIYKKYIDIVENPKDLSRLNTNLAFSYQELDSLNKAKKYYEKAIELDSNNWHVYNNYAYFYQKQGDLKTAEDMYKANIQRAPNIPNVLHSMGEFYQQMGEYDKAIDYFDSSIEIDSTYAISHYNLGQIYEERENDLFFEYYLKAAKLNNKDAQRWVKKNKNLIDEHNNKSKKAPAADYIEELKKLAELKSLGIITDEEFEAKKKELLGL
jgi:tetratricopeptide (TPR) repeat protein